MLFLLATWLKFNVTVAGRFSQVHSPTLSFRLQIVGQSCSCTRFPCDAHVCTYIWARFCMRLNHGIWTTDTRKIYTSGLKNKDHSQVYVTGTFCLIKATRWSLQCMCARYIFFSLSDSLCLPFVIWISAGYLGAANVVHYYFFKWILILTQKNMIYEYWIYKLYTHYVHKEI